MTHNENTLLNKYQQAALEHVKFMVRVYPEITLTEALFTKIIAREIEKHVNANTSIEHIDRLISNYKNNIG